jgi:hypothetical protein
MKMYINVFECKLYAKTFVSFSSHTFSNVMENAMNGSLSSAIFNRYSILIIEFPLDVEIGDDKSPIRCRCTGPPAQSPIA